MNDSTRPGERLLLTACHSNDCCPQVFEDPTAAEDRQIRIADDYGGQIFMSRGQFAALRGGTLAE